MAEGPLGSVPWRLPGRPVDSAWDAVRDAHERALTTRTLEEQVIESIRHYAIKLQRERQTVLRGERIKAQVAVMIALAGGERNREPDGGVYEP